LLLLSGLYIVSAVFNYIQQYLMVGVAQKSVYAMRREVEEKFERLPLKFYDSRTHGEILSRAVNDMDSISSTLQQNLTQLITSVVTVIGVIVLMLTISPLLTVVVALTLPVTRRAIAIGDVQAFIQYSRQFSQPIMQLSSIANTIQLTLASAERVFELLDEPEEDPDPAEARVIAEAQGAVQFEHVSFRYKD